MTAATAAPAATAADTEPRDGHPFREGDVVACPTQGVRRGECVGFEKIARHRPTLIRILFPDNQMTRRLPLAQVRAVGLRKLATPRTIAGALAKLTGYPRTNRLIWATRDREYLAKINPGHPEARAEAVLDLQLPGDSSASRSRPRDLFELAVNGRAGDVAMVSWTTKSDAIEFRYRTLTDAGRIVRASPTGQLFPCERRILVAKTVRRPYLSATALFSVG